MKRVFFSGESLYLRSLPLLLLFLLIQFLTLPLFAGENPSREVEEYLSFLMSPNPRERIMAARKISRSGLSDKKLYDFINGRLLREFNLNNRSRLHIDEMIWYCNALVSSGMTEYRKTMEEVAISSHGKLSRHAWQKLDLFEVYGKRNELMKGKEYVDNNLTADDALYISMVRSDKLRIKREGARLVYDKRDVNKKVFEIIDEEIMKGLNPLVNDRDHVDMLAWLCKALSVSRVRAYIKTLEQVIVSVNNEKLEKHARKSLERLKESILDN